MTQPPPNSVHTETRAEWRAWLDAHHTQTEGVWLISFKKGTGKPDALAWLKGLLAREL